MGGAPWEHIERYGSMLPLAHAPGVQIPMLIIHVENDHRCTISEAGQWFRSLRHLGRQVEFAWYRNESHGMLRNGRPVNRLDRLRRIFDWFDRYI